MEIVVKFHENQFIVNRKIAQIKLVVQTQIVKLHMTLTFDLPKCNLQMAHLPIKEKNYAKLFRNPPINIEVIVWTNQNRCTHTSTHKRVHPHTLKSLEIFILLNYDALFANEVNLKLGCVFGVCQ